MVNILKLLFIDRLELALLRPVSFDPGVARRPSPVARRTGRAGKQGAYARAPWGREPGVREGEAVRLFSAQMRSNRIRSSQRPGRARSG